MLSNAHLFLSLFIAFILGASIGVERIYSGKSTGIRVFGFVSLGAALFVIVSQVVAAQHAGSVGFNFDPLRVTAQIVTGIGFLGAGMIIFKNNHIENLNTAAGIWLAAGIGAATGFGMYWVAVFTTILVIFAYSFLFRIEKRLFLSKEEKENNPEQ